MPNSKEIADRYTRPEEKAEIHAYLGSTLDGTESDMQEPDESLDRMLLIKKQIRKVSEIIPLQYIAPKLFGEKYLPAQPAHQRQQCAR